MAHCRPPASTPPARCSCSGSRILNPRQQPVIENEAKELPTEDHSGGNVRCLRPVAVYAVRHPERDDLLVSEDGDGYHRDGPNPMRLALDADPKACEAEQHHYQTRDGGKKAHLWDGDAPVALEAPANIPMRKSAWRKCPSQETAYHFGHLAGRAFADDTADEEAGVYAAAVHNSLM